MKIDHHMRIAVGLEILAAVDRLRLGRIGRVALA